jgi:hypothetical protein
LDTDSKAGPYNSAVFAQNVDGTMAMTLGSTSVKSKVKTPPMNMTGKFLSSGTIYFSAEKGCMVRTDGTGDMELTLLMSSPKDGTPPQSATLDMMMKFQVYLLPMSK